MKTFEDGYFVPARFLKGVETFSKNAEKTDKAPLHVAYNVNDGYFQIMGASLVSVLENNAHRAVMFHIFTDGYSKENAQRWSSWLTAMAASSSSIPFIWSPLLIFMSKWSVFPGLLMEGL